MAKKKSSSGKDSKVEKVMEIAVPDGFSSFMTPVAVILGSLIIAVSILYVGSKITGDSSTLGVEDQNAESGEDADTGNDVVAEEPGDVVRTFETYTEYDTDICKEDGKPVVYLFSTTWCPHCTWIKDTFDQWAKDNSDKVTAYHWELDTSDNTLTSEEETEVPSEHEDVYNTFNPGGSIPTFVFGCRYGRVGNGFETEDDLDAERDAFDAVVNELI